MRKSGRDNPLSAPSPQTPLPPPPPPYTQPPHPSLVPSDIIGRLLYRYYNWRQDTVSDLQLFVALNTIVIAMGAWLRSTLVASPTPSPTPSDAPFPFWQDLYNVLTVILGQQLPEEQSPFAQQIFAVSTAVLGVASFALVLALIEQATLEMLEANVRRGSIVYEKDHYVVLTWGESARDLSQTATLLRQLCAASAAQRYPRNLSYNNNKKNSSVIVVLCAYKEKLELESFYREAVPVSDRCGCQIVFRQGSPIDPGALRMVGIVDARSIIITGDYSRSVEDSDAQVLRCAVLVDEAVAAAGKEWPEHYGPASLIASFPSTTVDHWKQYTTTTTTITEAAVRLQQEAKKPWVVAEVQGVNAPELLYYSCSDRIIPCPTSAINARRYARLLRHPVIAVLSHALFDHHSGSFADVGTYPSTGRHLLGLPFSHLAPYFPNSIIVGVVDLSTGRSELNPPPHRPLAIGEGLAMMVSSTCPATVTPPRMHPLPGYFDDARAMGTGGSGGGGWDPSQYSRASVDEAPLGRNPESLACVWRITGSSSGSSGSTATAASNGNGNGNGNENAPSSNVSKTLTTTMVQGPRAPPPKSPIMTRIDATIYARTDKNPNGAPSILRGMQSSSAQKRRMAASLVPLSYSSTAMGAGTDLLICGWAGTAVMWELLRELDQGVEALPPGTKILLLNNHPREVLQELCCFDTLRNVRIEHVQCDPRNRRQLVSSVDVATLRAAIILHDTHWVSDAQGHSTTASNDSIPYALSVSDMLRIDAAVLECQLNLRYVLELNCCPDINIITEKMTYLGQTRFEDRLSLPPGAAVNSSSYSAKILTKVAVQPLSLSVYGLLGVDCDIYVQDASAFASVGETLSFVTMQARCASVSQVLLGYYQLPTAVGQVMNIVVNPPEEERTVEWEWNCGDASCKMITLANKKKIVQEEEIAARKGLVGLGAGGTVEEEHASLRDQ